MITFNICNLVLISFFKINKLLIYNLYSCFIWTIWIWLYRRLWTGFSRQIFGTFFVFDVWCNHILVDKGITGTVCPQALISFCFLIAKVHAKLYDFSILLVHRYMQVFNILTHWCNLFGQNKSCIPHLIKLKLLLLHVLSHLHVYILRWHYMILLLRGLWVIIHITVWMSLWWKNILRIRWLVWSFHLINVRILVHHVWCFLGLVLNLFEILMLLVLLIAVVRVIMHHSLSKILIKHRENLLFYCLVCIDLLRMPFQHMWLRMWLRRLLRMLIYLLLRLHSLLWTMIVGLILHVILTLLHNVWILLTFRLLLSLLRHGYNLIYRHACNLLGSELTSVFNLRGTSIFSLWYIVILDLFLLLIMLQFIC